MNINDTKFTAETYETYANRIMYHPGLWNGSWLKKKDCRKYTSFELFLEFESRKLARKLFPLIDKQKFMQLRVIYIKELGNYLQYPRLCAYNFSENSPFRSARRCFWMLLVPLTLMILFSKVFYQKNSDFVMKKDLLQAFVMIAFLGAVSIFSTCILIAPYVEVRREMIGLFSILFGTFALLCYSVWFSFLTLYRFFTGSFLSGTTK